MKNSARRKTKMKSMKTMRKIRIEKVVQMDSRMPVAKTKRMRQKVAMLISIKVGVPLLPFWKKVEA
jgi:hypothetical protein